MFHGNNFALPLLMAAVFMCLVMCFSSLRGRLTAEIKKWEKEDYEIRRELEAKNSFEKSGEVFTSEVFYGFEK